MESGGVEPPSTLTAVNESIIATVPLQIASGILLQDKTIPIILLLT